MSKPKAKLAPASKQKESESRVFNTLGNLTKDGFDNFLSRVGLQNDNSLSASTYVPYLITRNRLLLENAYRGSWMVGAVVDSVADDMTRSGIDITTNEGEKDLKDLKTAISRLGVWGSIRDVIKWGRLYGGSIGVLQIDGQDFKSPLRIETISKGQFLGVVPYDRWQLNPDLSNVIQQGPNMGLPEFYNIVTSAQNAGAQSDNSSIGQIRVHHSRCLRMVGIKLPFFQALQEMMWGESELERLWDRLIAFDNATMSAGSLIDRANLRTIQVEGLREILAAGGKAQQGLEKMFEMVRFMQDNMGITLLDKNDEFKTDSYTFAGLSDMLLQFGQQLAGASGIPLVRLFGQSPSGLNSTGDADLRMYYDNINAKQESTMRPWWDVLLKVMWRSTFETDAPKDLEFSFSPLWQTSSLDKATIAKTNTDTITEAFDLGLISRPTAMEELRGLSGGTGLFSNITDDEIQEAEVEDPPEPEMSMPEGENPKEKQDKTDAPGSDPEAAPKADA